MWEKRVTARVSRYGLWSQLCQSMAGWLEEATFPLRAPFFFFKKRVSHEISPMSPFCFVLLCTIWIMNPIAPKWQPRLVTSQTKTQLWLPKQRLKSETSPRVGGIKWKIQSWPVRHLQRRPAANAHCNGHSSTGPGGQRALHFLKQSSLALAASKSVSRQSL